MANMFDENGNYNKTEWKPGDRITAGKLNKIEESLEAINNNDIERHKEADERLDALEEQKEAVEERFDELEDLVADNKTEVDTSIYEVHSKMDRLEQEMNDGIDTVEAIANTVDDKIAEADASMKAQVAEVEADLEGLHAKDEELSEQLAHNANILEDIVLNIKDFICDDGEYVKGDGIHDDTTGIQKAIDYLKVNEVRGKLFFPAGNYKITKSINISHSGFWIDGDGKRGQSNNGYQGSQISFYGDIGQPIFNVTKGTDSVIYKAMFTNIRLCGNSKVEGVEGIRFTNVSEFTIENCNFNGGFEKAIYLNRSFIGAISDCDLSSNKDGIYLTNCVSIWIDKINGWKNSGSCFTLYQDCSGISFQNSWVEYNQNCFNIYHDNLERTVIQNINIQNVHYSVGSADYPECRFLNVISNGNNEVLDFSYINIIGCRMYANNTSCFIEFSFANSHSGSKSNGINIIGCIFTAGSNTVLTGAIISDSKKVDILCLGQQRTSNISGTNFPLLYGNARLLELNVQFSYSNLSSNVPLKIPVSPSLENYSEGQIWCKDGYLKFTDGEKTCTIPKQGTNTIPLSNADDLSQLKTDLNNLITELKNIKVIK